MLRFFHVLDTAFSAAPYMVSGCISSLKPHLFCLFRNHEINQPRPLPSRERECPGGGDISHYLHSLSFLLHLCRILPSCAFPSDHISLHGFIFPSPSLVFFFQLSMFLPLQLYISLSRHLKNITCLFISFFTVCQSQNSSVCLLFSSSSMFFRQEGMAEA